MGTNYYWYETGICEHCGRHDAGVHIGKSSAGWCFSLHVYDESWQEPEDVIKSLAEWQERWSRPGSVILDEYGDRVSPDDMYSIITVRSGTAAERGWDPTFARDNDARPGPNGLWRHGHGREPGDGTYDLCRGEFS